MFKVGEYEWDSKEEYIEFVSWLTKKLSLLKESGYILQPSFGGNWVEVIYMNNKNYVCDLKVFCAPNGHKLGCISKMTIRNIETDFEFYDYDGEVQENQLIKDAIAFRMFKDLVEIFNKPVTIQN